MVIDGPALLALVDAVACEDPRSEQLLGEVYDALERVYALRDHWLTQGHHARWRAEVLTAALDGTPNKYLPQ